MSLAIANKLRAARTEIRGLRHALEIVERERWIPVGERLPDADTTVIVSFDPASDPGEPVWLGYLDDGTWRDVEGKAWPVTHWMPLPEPAKA